MERDLHRERVWNRFMETNFMILLAHFFCLLDDPTHTRYAKFNIIARSFQKQTA